MTAALAPMGTLIAPATVAGLPLTSRFVMAPMTRSMSPGGAPTPEVAAYYARRAANGVGLIITEGIIVDHPSAGSEPAVPRLAAGPTTAAWRRVTDEVHAAGGRIAAQLWHLGSERKPLDGRPAWTPSGLPAGSHAITLAETDDLLRAYESSAHAAVRAGFDAVEIHAAHGYLLDEFLWPLANVRTDRFGGSVADRADHLGRERGAIPAAMPLIVRFSQFKERDYAARIAATPAELAVILEAFAAAGADVLHASQRRFWEPAFPGDPRNLAGWAKHLTGLPAITVGSVGLDVAARPLTELRSRVDAGEFDLVAVGRQLLGNPAWVRLAAEGRFDEIRPYQKSHEDIYF